MPDKPSSNEPVQIQPQPAGTPVLVKMEQPIPMVYADGVSAQYFAGGITKTHFFRLDPDPMGVGPTVPAQVLQLILPAHGFAAMAVFFERRIAQMISDGVFTKDYVESLRNTLSQT
jgi:hypothetical protein